MRPAELVRTLLAGALDAGLAYETAPSWLLRPGQPECGEAWPVVAAAYRGLTGGELPTEAPLRERRRVDVIVEYPDGHRQIIEIDERQHFTAARAMTLDHYPASLQLGFAPDVWRAHAVRLTGREPGGGFARPCPPLFPSQGGRHQQRAFRDLLADLVPPQHGWLPTVRISEWEVARWTLHDTARLCELLAGRHVPEAFLRT